MSNPTDELYGNRYRVIGLLGTGGMARVYRARDELLGREVALKVLSERLSSDRSFVERFRREAQNAAGLNHPNIVALYDYGDEDNRYFIVMELIEGRSLSEVLDEDGALMPERAAEIARDTANGLGRAHEAGIVHRDIKPHNIMITNSGQTKVTDFGISARPRWRCRGHDDANRNGHRNCRVSLARTGAGKSGRREERRVLARLRAARGLDW